MFYVFYSFFITYRLYYHHIVAPGHNIQQNRDLHGCTAFDLYIPSFWELSYILELVLQYCNLASRVAPDLGGSRRAPKMLHITTLGALDP